MENTNRFANLKSQHPLLWRVFLFFFAIILILTALTAGYLAAAALNAPVLSGITSFINWLLGLSTTQVTWYVTRSAGLIAYLLLWLSTVWGLAVSSKILEGKLHGVYTYDFHQFISLLAIGFLGLHLVMLLLDQYLTFSIPQLLIPFLATYRPIWVALGILSFYLVLLVTVTFYMRDRIGGPAFRAIHTLSLVSFLGAAVHGLLAGTDGPLPIVTLMYAVTTLSVVFLTVYWVVLLIQKKRLARTATAAQSTRPLPAHRAPGR